MSHHSGIQMPPAFVNETNEKQIWWQMYLPEAFFDGTIERKKPVKFKYAVGDTVRISHTREKFDRKYSKQFSTEVFTITHRFERQGLPLYKLKNLLGKPLTGSFYEQEITPFDYDPGRIEKIEEILQKRTRKGKKEVFVSWKGWPEEHNSWIPASAVKDL